jgi:hypothetical protein
MNSKKRSIDFYPLTNLILPVLVQMLFARFETAIRGFDIPEKSYLTNPYLYGENSRYRRSSAVFALGRRGPWMMRMKMPDDSCKCLWLRWTGGLKS